MDKKIYFVSDAHLGSLAFDNDSYREKKLVAWLDSIKDYASDIYLLGDMFDFWYEYKYVVPKGFVRFLGKLAELSDSGINLHFFIGNHDIWTYGYLEKEIGMKIYKEPLIINLNGKTFYLAHGNGLGKQPLSVRLIERIFHSEILRTLYNTIHPYFNMSFGFAWSKSNRKSKQNLPENNFLGENKEHLIIFAKSILKKQHIDYFIFGHRHIMVNFMLQKNSQVIYLGDWITNFSYGVFDGENFTLEQFEGNTPST